MTHDFLTTSCMLVWLSIHGTKVAAESGLDLTDFLGGEDLNKKKAKKVKAVSTKKKGDPSQDRLVRMEGEGKRAFHRRLKR